MFTFDLQRTPAAIACGTVRMWPPRVLHKQLKCGQPEFPRRRRSIKDGGVAKFLKSNKMPKRLVSEGWVKKPCLYRLPAGATRVCTWCQEPFTFWNGRHHCAFCTVQSVLESVALKENSSSAASVFTVTSTAPMRRNCAQVKLTMDNISPHTT